MPGALEGQQKESEAEMMTKRVRVSLRKSHWEGHGGGAGWRAWAILLSVKGSKGRFWEDD